MRKAANGNGLWGLRNGATERKNLDVLVEPMGDFAASENKTLTSIDPDFSSKNGTIFDPKCNQKCNQQGATIARNRCGWQVSWGDPKLASPSLS